MPHPVARGTSYGFPAARWSKMTSHAQLLLAAEAMLGAGFNEHGRAFANRD
jgi:hypothetical protein